MVYLRNDSQAIMNGDKSDLHATLAKRFDEMLHHITDTTIGKPSAVTELVKTLMEEVYLRNDSQAIMNGDKSDLHATLAKRFDEMLHHVTDTTIGKPSAVTELVKTLMEEINVVFTSRAITTYDTMASNAISAKVINYMVLLSTGTSTFMENAEISLREINVVFTSRAITTYDTMASNAISAKVINYMVLLSTGTSTFMENAEIFLREVQKITTILQKSLTEVKLPRRKKLNLQVKPMHMTLDENMYKYSVLQTISYKKCYLDGLDSDRMLASLIFDLDNSFQKAFLYQMFLKNDAKYDFKIQQNTSHVLKEKVDKQKSKLGCVKKLCGAELTYKYQYMEYLNKIFLKRLNDNYHLEAMSSNIFDGYTDSNIEKEPNTTAENAQTTTMEKQIKTSKTSQEPRREKMPSKSRFYSAQPDRGSIEILDGRYLADFFLPSKDRPHVLFPASHPLLMAKIRFIGQSSELNTFVHRIRSFVLGENPKHNSWPDDAMVRPLPLACSGFSYEGNGKEIVCKYCGFKTDTYSWNDNDEKYGMSIHRKAGTLCPFMNSFIDSEVVIPEDNEELDQDQSQVNTFYFLFCRNETFFQDIKILNTFFIGRGIQYLQPINVHDVEELVDGWILNELNIKQKHIYDKHFSNDKKQYRKNM